MIYQVRIINLNDDVEEEVELQINEEKLSCFAGVCPYPLKVGNSYPAKLELVVLNDYNVRESLNSEGPAFVRMNRTFSYLVRGRLKGTCLEAGEAVFEDEFLQKNYWYLDGKVVELNVDRIDVEFLV